MATGSASRGAAADPAFKQYLLFQMFIGQADPESGVFRRGVSKAEMLAIAEHIRDSIGPPAPDSDRLLGFAIGPVALDQGAEDARATIIEAFDVAIQTGLAIAVHLDDYMFWKDARLSDGKLASSAPDAIEWVDWNKTPASGLEIGWLPGVKLQAQMCYESPAMVAFVQSWTTGVIGKTIKEQVDRLAAAGKQSLFAGVVAGWESNLSQGYCSLTYLGYGEQNPPPDFDRARETVLQRHIALWARGLAEAGLPKDQIYTHIAPMPQSDFARLVAAKSRDSIRRMPQSTSFSAYWTASNSYSLPGFSAYVDPTRFTDIYNALTSTDSSKWAMSEGTNVSLGPDNPGGVGPSRLSWETYLARFFNHGATLVNIFGGFQGPSDSPFRRATENPSAIAAYRKFLSGEKLVESNEP